MKNLKNILLSNQDKKYKEFHKKLKGGENIIGVRMPILREIVKGFLKEKTKKEILDFIQNYHSKYSEERILKAIFLAKIDLDESEKIKITEKFIKNEINSWAICDTFCADLKLKNREIWYKFIKKFRDSKKEFETRFFFVMFFKHFREDKYLSDFIRYSLENKNETYYTKMAISWGICEFYLKFPKEITKLLKSQKLEKFVQNKAISKICDSFRVDKKEKIYLKGFSIK